MRKIARMQGAFKSRAIAVLGYLGIKARRKNLLGVLARQYGESSSLEAFAFLLSLLENAPATRQVALLVPDDMRKAFSFIRRHIGNPELIRLSECGARNPDVFLLKKEFLFQVHQCLANRIGSLLKHFENPVWLVLSDGAMPGGERYTADELDAACSEARKTTVPGYGGTVLSVRPGTNDYQIVKEVASTYLPDVAKWMEKDNDGGIKRIIDLGGHIGSFSVQVNALLAGNCEIHIYEPEPSNFAQIKKNIALNHAGNIKLFNLAISSVAGQSVISLNSENTGGHQVGSKLSYDTEEIPVEAVTLDSVFAR